MPRPERAALHFILSLVANAFVSSGALADRARHPGFVDAGQAIGGLQLEIRYFGNDNFVGRRIDGYEAPLCLLTREAATALGAVQRDLAALGLGLKAFDCYRPVSAVAHFVRWARDLSDQSRKADYYPETSKYDLFRDGYISARSGHSRGSTVDLTLVRLAGGPVPDMGSPFDFFGPRSWPSDRTVPAEARENRRILAAAMKRRGFRAYAKEWWHFTLNAEPYPETYFNFSVREPRPG